MIAQVGPAGAGIPSAPTGRTGESGKAGASFQSTLEALLASAPPVHGGAVKTETEGPVTHRPSPKASPMTALGVPQQEPQRAMPWHLPGPAGHGTVSRSAEGTLGTGKVSPSIHPTERLVAGRDEPHPPAAAGTTGRPELRPSGSQPSGPLSVPSTGAMATGTLTSKVPETRVFSARVLQSKRAAVEPRATSKVASEPLARSDSPDLPSVALTGHGSEPAPLHGRPVTGDHGPQPSSPVTAEAPGLYPAPAPVATTPALGVQATELGSQVGAAVAGHLANLPPNIGRTVLRVAVNPPHLGPVTVTLTRSAAGVTVAVAAASMEAGSALNLGKDEIRRRVEASLGTETSVDVSVTAPRSTPSSSVEGRSR